MSNEKSLKWLDKLSELKAELKKKTPPNNDELAKKLNLSKSMLSFYKTINNCFDESAVDKVRRAAQGPRPHTLSFKSALALAGIKDKVSDLPGAAHAVLDAALSRRLAKRKIAALVDWVASGKPAQDFDPAKAGKKSPETAAHGSDSTPGQAVETEGEQAGEPPSNHDPGSKTRHSNWAFVMAPFKYVLNFFGSFTGINEKNLEAKNLGKASRKGLAALFKAVWHGIKRAAGWMIHVVWRIIGRPISYIAGLAIIVGIAIGVILRVFSPPTYHEYVNYLRGETTQLISTIIHSSLSIIHSNLSAVGNNPNGSNEATNAEPSSIFHSPLSIIHSGASAPESWSASIESKTQMINELFPIPGYCLIQPILSLPVTDMDGEKAGNLSALLQDANKYSIWYGNDRVTIESAPVNPASLAFFFKDRGPVEMNWNTLRAVHCDELQAVGEHMVQTLYQCGLVSSGLEKAIEIECAEPGDFNNLAAAVLYWAKGVKPTGLPYVHQGMIPDGSGKAGVLWAGSPAEKAGLRIGDMVWGLDQDGDSQQKPVEVVNQLDDLKPGSHSLYVIRGGKVPPKTARTRLELKVPERQF